MFERENRVWFERYIASRGDSFYSEDSIEEHIKTLMENVERGSAYSMVVFDKQEIVARGNLTDIAHGIAYVGYRVAEKAINKGCASRCLQALTRVAIDMGLSRLRARVLDNNPMSQRVLIKQGFAAIEYQPNFIEIQQQPQGCTLFEKLL